MLSTMTYEVTPLQSKTCHEDLILTRKSYDCPGIGFIQGDSAGGSKLIEQTLAREETTGAN